MIRTPNPYGKSRPTDNPYFTIESGDWTWKVLKLYKSVKASMADPYSRAFCQVITPMTGSLGDLGDVYCSEVPRLFYFINKQSTEVSK